MAIKLTMGSGIVCPNCKREMIAESGIIGSMFFNAVVDKLKKQGGTVKCKCGHNYKVQPTPKPLPFWKRLISR